MTTTLTGIESEAEVADFAGRLLGLYTGALLSAMIDVGHRTGLFEAAALGEVTSEELADRAGLHERYVREWLGSMVTSGIIDYHPAGRTYLLPAAHAACLTGPGSGNLAPLSRLNTHLTEHVGEVVRAFREGGGVPFAAYQPDFTDVMDAAGRGGYDADLVDSWLPLVPRLSETLAAGARVADVACGTGHALVVLGRAFPRSTFVGYDRSESAIVQARAEAAADGLSNVRFEVADVARLRIDVPFDAIFVFDAIHDQAEPQTVLDNIFRALVPGGRFFMKEPRVSSNLEENVGNPLAPVLYAVSTLHCLTVSLAEGGAGLGTAWGQQKALQMLADAGFGDVVVHDVPTDPMDAIFVTTRN